MNSYSRWHLPYIAFGGACTPNSVAHFMQVHLVTEISRKTLTTSPSPNMSYTIPFTITAIRKDVSAESFLLYTYTSFVDLSYSQSEVKLQVHGKCGPGIAWTKIGDFGEATTRLVKDYVDSSVGVHYR